MTDHRVRFLDGCRGFAALYVAGGHILENQLSPLPGWLHLATRFGQEAVIIFFVLSGYVIQASVADAPGQTAGRFLWRRFLRLYPLLALTLVVTYLTTCLAQGQWVPPYVGQAIAHLLALQDFASVKPGVLVPTYWGNAPLWSLSYECWFYLFFAFLHWRVRPGHRGTVVAGTCLAGGALLSIWPGALAYWSSYFSIWWAGRCLALGDSPEARREKRHAVVLLALVNVLAIGPVMLARHHAEPLALGTFPLLPVRHLGTGLALVTMTWISPRWLDAAVHGLVWPFIPVAGWSYGLYVLHAPLAANHRWLPISLPPWGSLVVYGSIGLALSWWGERKYHVAVRRWLERRVASRVFAGEKRAG